MITCSNCQTQNRDGARFCAKCRAPLTSPNPASPTPPPPTPPPPIGPAAGPATPMPGEPDIAKLLEQLPELDIKTTELEIPVPPIDVNAEVERLTQLDLNELFKIIQQLEQQLQATDSGSSKP